MFYGESRVSRAPAQTTKHKSDKFSANIVNDHTSRFRDRAAALGPSSDTARSFQFLFSVARPPLPLSLAIAIRSISKTTLPSSFPKSGRSMYFPGGRRTSLPLLAALPRPLFTTNSFSPAASILRPSQDGTLARRIVTDGKSGRIHACSNCLLSFPSAPSRNQHTDLLCNLDLPTITSTLSCDDSTTIPYFAASSDRETTSQKAFLRDIRAKALTFCIWKRRLGFCLPLLHLYTGWIGSSLFLFIWSLIASVLLHSTLDFELLFAQFAQLSLIGSWNLRSIDPVKIFGGMSKTSN